MKYVDIFEKNTDGVWNKDSQKDWLSQIQIQLEKNEYLRMSHRYCSNQ